MVILRNNFWLGLISFLILSNSFAQVNPKVKVYYESVKNGYQLFIDNDEVCEVSVVLRLNLENLRANTNRKRIFVIPPQQSKANLSKLSAIRQGKYGFSFKYNTYRGNISKISYDVNFAYSLPYKKGFTALIGQGYDGKYTHQNINALDFDMPIGTPITAIRDGKVVVVQDGFYKHGKTADFAKYANFILVQHSDGTFAKYAHLKVNSAKVKVGDLIRQNQEIALSGNTGWTTGPHLHLEVYLPRELSPQSIKTQFKINKGQISSFLKEQQSYKRDY